MADKPKRPWTVEEHSTLQKIDDNLWGIEGYVPGARIPRRMCIIKRSDGSLLFFHAIPVDEKTLNEIRMLGTPAYLVVGHDQHMMDAHAFQEKLGLKVYAPKEVEAKARARATVTGTLESIPSDPSMDIMSVPGTKHGETAIVVRSGDGVNLLVSDVLQNTPPEATSFMFRLLGFSAKAPKIVPVFKMMFIKDKAVLKDALMKWAQTPNLKRLVPFHGKIVDTDAAGAIRAAAARL